MNQDRQNQTSPTSTYESVWHTQTRPPIHLKKIFAKAFITVKLCSVFKFEIKDNNIE